MPLHVFVAMPFGIKDGVDFNRVYTELIRPAIEGEGLVVFRADEEQRAGDIRTDMFQELLLADVVIADLSVDNPERLVRARRAPCAARARRHLHRVPPGPHALRRLYGSQAALPHEGRRARRRSAGAGQSGAGHHGARNHRRVARPQKQSRSISCCPYLQEPNWKTLRVGGVQEVWEQQEAWAQRLATARRKQRPSDVLVLAEEAPAQALRQEAHLIAARTLRQLNQPAFALEQVEKALALDPAHLTARQEKGILLGRLERYDEAKEWLQSVARDCPDDAETCGLLGRVAKDLWESSWRKPDAAPAI